MKNKNFIAFGDSKRLSETEKKIISRMLLTLLITWNKYLKRKMRLKENKKSLSTENLSVNKV